MKGLRNNVTLTDVANEKIHCHYCQSVSNYCFSFYHRTYYHCPSCDLIFASREEDANTVIAYYRDLYFDNEAEDQMSGRRTNLYRHILDVLEDYKNPGSLLDLGCGCGFFLKEARERGWQVSGVDPSEKSIAYARSLIGDNAVCGTLDNVPTGRRFDAITLINVLDHMVDACQQLQKVQDLLAPEGIIYLRFPNGSFHSFVMRLSLMLSAKQFMNPFLIFHEYAITPRAIRRCLGDMGFADIRIFNSRLAGNDLFLAGWTFAKLTMKILSSLTWGFFKSLEKLSGGRWLWGSSLQVIARKGTGGRRP
jgi:2-polyprenyl-3-methyl-5-hydroxy-6-metoxy-1,4-benzoquinol methylase